MPIVESRGSIVDWLKRIFAATRDLSPIADEVRRTLWEANRQRALKGLDYHGRPLAKLATSTLEDRASKGYPLNPPLVRRGEQSHLIGGCVVDVRQVGNHEITFAKSWPGADWMEAHSHGGGRLPVRDVYGFGDEELAKVRELLPRHVTSRIIATRGPDV